MYLKSTLSSKELTPPQKAAERCGRMDHLPQLFSELYSPYKQSSGRGWIIVPTVLCVDPPGAQIYLNAPMRKQVGSQLCSFLGSTVPAQQRLCRGPCWHILSHHQGSIPLQASGIIATFSMSVVCIPTLCEQKLLLLSGRLGKAHITDNILLWLREIKVDKNHVIRDSCRTSKPHSSEFLMSDSREGTGV